MEIFWSPEAGPRPTKLLRRLVEVHRWLPARFAERASWTLSAFAVKRYRAAVPGADAGMSAKWGAGIRLRGAGTLTFSGGFHIDPAVSFEVDGVVRFGPGIIIERFSVIKTFGKSLIAGSGVYIGSGCHIDSFGGLTIGDGALLAPGCKVLAFNHGMRADLPRSTQPLTGKGISIGANAWLGAGVVVLDGVSIGENAIVGAGSIVTHDVPANALVAGNPARVIRDLSDTSQGERASRRP